MLDSKIIGKTLYIGLNGELDEHYATHIRKQLDELIDNVKADKVIVELSGLSFMDSTGIGVLLGRYKKLQARGIPLYLANPSVSIDKILLLSGLYGIMPKINFKEA